MRQRQLVNFHQDQDPLINLIDESQRLYILELSYKLCTDLDLFIDLFTHEEKLFWNAFDPQERNLLLTGDP